MHEPVIRGIPELVALKLGVTLEAMLSRQCDHMVVRARQVSMWLACRVAHCTQSHVARYFDRDHTTVMHALRRVDRLMASDEGFSRTIWRLARDLDADEASDMRRTMIRRVA